MSRKNRLIAKQHHTAPKQNPHSSTGPITPEGKAASAQNSFRHGLTASAITMIAGEDPKDYMDLGNSLRAEHNATTPTEDALVTKMIESLWLSARAIKLQQALFREPQYRRLDLDLYMRYQTMHDRAFSKAMADLLKLRSENRKVRHEARDLTKKDQNDFVSQTHKQQLHEARIHNINVRTAATEFALQLRKSKAAPRFTPQPGTGVKQQAA